MKSIVSCALTGALLLLLALGASAQGGFSDPPDVSSADMALADLLLEKGLISQAEWENIRAKIGQAEAQSEERAIARTLERLAQQPPPEGWDLEGSNIDFGSSGLKLKSKDGDFTFGLGGRMQLDGAAYDEGKAKLGNGTEVRRARIRMSGTVKEEWGYKFEVDFSASGSADITDAWIKYGPWESSDILIGHQKVPFSQQSMTSSNWQLFQERALPDVFIDNRASGRRRMGATASTWGDHYYGSAGLFGEGLDDDGRNNEDWGVAGRFVAAPVKEADQVLAFGASTVFRDLSDNSTLRYGARPESHISGTRIVDTGILSGAEDVTMANAELTMVNGPFHAEAEYFDVSVNRSGMRTVNFDGYYAQLGYFLTEDSRDFSMKGAKFGRVKPKDENGAWELAARFSSIDLSSRDVRGGRQENSTFGVNWWINASTAMRFNYVYIHAMETAQSLGFGSSGDHASAVQARFQVVF